MINSKIIYRYLYSLSALLMLTACIENDIPYPYREGSISEFVLEGQSGNVEINKVDRVITVNVDDAVDIRSLQIKKMLVTNDAKIVIDSLYCIDYKNFPRIGFVSLDSLPKTANTRLNFSSPVSLILKTYQEYPWKITVNQVINRKIEVSNQFGQPIIDEHNKQIIVYVSKEQRLDNVKVTEMALGGTAGIVTPDPTTVTDFSRPRNFTVTRFGEEEKWTVTILHSEGGIVSGEENVVMVKQILVSGGIQEGKIPIIEYKEKKASDWTTLPENNIAVQGTTFSATIQGLNSSTTYVYRISVDGKVGSETECTTAAEVALTNGGFEDWNKDEKLWNPWSQNGTSFWDTGNKGAITIGESNTVPTDDTSTGVGKAAKLESKFIAVAGIGKFAAGNIFSGVYVRTDKTNGVLSFGRSFTTYPSALKFYYKYTSQEINKCNDSDYEYLKGRPDSCHIYIALTDWSEPYEIRTKKADRQLFDKNDKNIIAFGEFVSSEDVSSYTEQIIKLNYRSHRTPKYILVVATASKYGDFFTGGEGSTLWLDEMELVYE